MVKQKPFKKDTRDFTTGIKTIIQEKTINEEKWKGRTLNMKLNRYEPLLKYEEPIEINDNDEPITETENDELVDLGDGRVWCPCSSSVLETQIQKNIKNG